MKNYTYKKRILNSYADDALAKEVLMHDGFPSHIESFFIDLIPQKRTIFFEKKNYFLSFPKTNIKIFRLFWRCNIVTCKTFLAFISQDNDFLALPLTNINHQNIVCLGHEFLKKISDIKIKDVDICELTIQSIFYSSFNADFLENIYFYWGSHFDVSHLLADWEKKTKANPNWIPNQNDFPLNYQNIQCWIEK